LQAAALFRESLAINLQVNFNFRPINRLPTPENNNFSIISGNFLPFFRAGSESDMCEQDVKAISRFFFFAILRM
jgi:hypothetical protein